tara:strand:+ start:102772 stop:102897 length:126 start_codon:yes stop_codon:yes gene_type:complete
MTLLSGVVELIIGGIHFVGRRFSYPQINLPPNHQPMPGSVQ